jgi:signal transduction histidine kinase
MGKLVREVLSELGQVQDGRTVNITVGDLPPVLADPILVKQVWLNLLSNSLKFTRNKASAEIGVDCWKSDSGQLAPFGFEPRDRSSRCVVYYVRDNGAGFDATQSGRLFRAFQRLHHSEEFEGSGLGLAIVERIVRRHGGRVGAEGDVDWGALFWFSLEN